MRAYVTGDGFYPVRGINKQAADANGEFTADPAANIVNTTLPADTSPPAGTRGIIAKSITAVAVTAGTPVAVWTPAPGKRARVLGGQFSSSAISSLIIKDNAVATGILSALLAAAGIFTLPDLRSGYLSTAPNNAIQVDCTVTTTVSGFLYGYEE